MKYLLLLLALLIIVSSCVYGPTPEAPKSPEVEVETPVEKVPDVVEDPKPEIDQDDIEHTASTPIGPEYPIKDAKKIFTVVIKDTNYFDYQKEKLKKASLVIAKIMNSEEFKKKVIDHTYQGKKTYVDNNGLTNEQIWEKVFAGAEALQPAINYQLDLTVTMYNKSYSSVVGYTYPSDLKVYTNRKFHDKYGACDVAGNLFHEWTHKLGFGHSYEYTKSRESSVPYALGYLLEGLCPKYL